MIQTFNLILLLLLFQFVRPCFYWLILPHLMLLLLLYHLLLFQFSKQLQMDMERYLDVKVNNKFIIAHNKMINSDLLLKKLRTNSSVQPLLETSRLAQIKLAKIVYNNRSIREIGKFINQANSIIRKSKQGENQKRVRTQNNEHKGSYDENELKQLTYQFQSIREQYLDVIHESNIDFGINSNGNRRRQTIKNRPRQLSKITLKRRPTVTAHHSAVPFENRLNTGKNIFNSLSKPLSINEPLSPNRIKRRLTGLMQNYHQETKIALKEEEIQKAINNLMKLVNTKEAYDYNIGNQIIFKMIFQKYLSKPKNQTDQQPNQKSQSHSQNQKFPVELPYCQFAGLKGCRKSIDRIFNIPLKAAQRIAFKIYDRNRNGVIDEKDIIQLFSQGQKNQFIQQDLQIIIKNYKVTQSDKNFSSPRGKKHTTRKIVDQSQYSISKLNKIQVIEEKPQEMESKKFRKSAFFIFKETKEQFFKKKQSSIAQISLNWEDFQIAFKNTRPKIFYDLLDYLFNVNSEQIYERSQKLVSEQHRNSLKNLILYNNDGRSQAASNFNTEIQIEQNERRFRKKTVQYSKASQGNKTTSKKKKQSSAMLSKFKIKEEKQMNTRTIEDLITKVKSIQKFQSVQY